jgi:L-rhamnose isomerase / sugar isomerase
MVDQSHDLKGKMEAMIQTVCTAQELYAKAAIVDHARLAPLQQSCSLVEAEETLRGAFWYDVRAGLARMAAQSRSAGRSQAGLPGQRIPEAITAERQERNAVSVTTYT